MTERGVGFSPKNHRRVSRVTLAFERGELGSQSGPPSSRKPRRREPIRAMLLGDLETHSEGDVAEVDAVVFTPLPSGSRGYVVRVTSGRAGDPSAEPLLLRLRVNGVHTEDIRETDTAADVQALLEGVAAIGTDNVRVYGVGQTWGDNDAPHGWNVRLWIIALTGNAAEVTLSHGRPRSNDALISVVRTRWRPVPHVERVSALWPLPDTLYEGTFVWAVLAGGCFAIVSYECWEQGA